MAQPTMEADKMLDVYIHDYLVKRKYSNSARTFHTEAQLPTKPTAIDTPGGFLYEWWSIFWDIFIARYKRTEANNEALLMKAQEQLQQQKRHQNSELQWLQQMQMQLVLQKHIVQQQRQQQRQGVETRLQHGIASNNLAKQNLGMSDASSQKMYNEDLNPQTQKDILGAEMKKLMQPKHNENVGQLSDATHASILRSAVSGDQPPGQMIHNTPVGKLTSLRGMKDRKQQLLASEDLKNLMNPPITPSAGSYGSSNGATGSNQVVTTFPLKGWPLMKKCFGHPYQPSQLQLHQQIRMLLSDQNVGMENTRKDNLWKVVGNVVPNFLQVQVGLPVLSGGDAEMLSKLYEQQPQKIDDCHQQFMQPTPLGPLSENSNYQPQQLDKMGTTGTTEDVAVSNTSRDNSNQALTDRALKKRKQPMSSAGPADISRVANDTALCPSLSPSAPSTHITGDVISMPAVPAEDNSSRADVDQFGSNGPLEEDVESGNPESGNPESGNTTTGWSDANQDIKFSEIATIYSDRVKCCDFSSDGKLFATGGDDKKAMLWCTESGKEKYAFEHSDIITDLRFGPRLPRLATCSLDKTVKIWNADNPGCPIRTFIGHTAPVISVDFHPKKEDLVCSCDDASAIRHWSIKSGRCSGVSKGGATQVRFQPTRGRYLAAAVANGVSIIDVETAQTCRYLIKGHATDVLMVCWNSSGDYLASMSEDLISVWKIGSWGQQDCMHELSITGKKFRCCAFHPCHPSLLVIGFTQSLELWHMAENKMMTALGQPTNCLAVSKPAGLVASVTDDNLIRLWK